MVEIPYIDEDVPSEVKNKILNQIISSEEKLIAIFQGKVNRCVFDPNEKGCKEVEMQGTTQYLVVTGNKIIFYAPPAFLRSEVIAEKEFSEISQIFFRNWRPGPRIGIYSKGLVDSIYLSEEKVDFAFKFIYDYFKGLQKDNKTQNITVILEKRPNYPIYNVLEEKKDIVNKIWKKVKFDNEELVSVFWATIVPIKGQNEPFTGDGYLLLSNIRLISLMIKQEELIWDDFIYYQDIAKITEQIQFGRKRFDISGIKRNKIAVHLYGDRIGDFKRIIEEDIRNAFPNAGHQTVESPFTVSWSPGS